MAFSCFLYFACYDGNSILLEVDKLSQLKRFAFWLPLLACLNYVFELTVNPIKDILLTDPLLQRSLRMMGDIGYDSDQYQLLFPGFLVHFFLWFVYGRMIDWFVKQLI